MALLPAALLSAGCEWGPDDSGPTVVSPPAGTPAVDSDVTVVEQAVAALSAAHATVSVGPGRKRARAQFLVLHETHLEHLGEAVPAPAADLTTATDATGWRSVVRTERDLQDTLASLAGAADSGALAQTLAAMAAGTAQLLASHTAGPADV